MPNLAKIDATMRPRLHFAPAANWLSDPNGLVHDGRRWHLFYQYNPHGEDWGHMAWGHAVSDDLLSWRELEPALLEDERHMIFSGSAVIDHADTAGFGPGAMVAIYTGADCGERPRQAQCLAYSNDHGMSWTKYAGNPVLDLGLADFRDPNVFWHEPSRRWIMTVALSTDNALLLFASKDLKAWTELSRIENDGITGHLWECPILVELPVEGSSETRWMVKVDVCHGAPASGAFYRTGTFDGVRFRADPGEWRLVDHGRDYYAAIHWNGPRDTAGRPAWIGWMGNHGYQKDLPRRGYRGAMSLPRRMSLRRVEGDYRLVQMVEPSAVDAAALVSDVDELPPLARIAIDRAAVIRDANGAGFDVAPDGDCWRIIRRDPRLPFLAFEAVMPRRAGVGLTLWLDSDSVEVLSDDGLDCASLQHRLEGTLRLDFAAPLAACA